VGDCQAEFGVIHASCCACLDRQAQLHAAANRAMAEEQQFSLADSFEAAVGDDAADGVDSTPADEFDNAFGNGADLMDVDLLTDSAVSAREATLLNSLNEKLDAINFETCDSCWEEGFDLNVKDRMCGTCRRDKDPVKKWSEANAVHPGTYSYRHEDQGTDLIIGTLRSSLFVWTYRHGGHVNCPYQNLHASPMDEGSTAVLQ
jgi:hypothetical protein